MLVSLEPKVWRTNEAVTRIIVLHIWKPRRGTCTEVAALLLRATLPTASIYNYTVEYYLYPHLILDIGILKKKIIKNYLHIKFRSRTSIHKISFGIW
jgi:hypothetical protein